ncbi:MAG TPA: hypothetical protein DDZ51_28445, partial [Planctomycetaceae bacterium]|nr:hypothetical protein [Planctomycetaceae bacterium]
MSNNPDPQSQPPVQWSDADDRAMDALLKELFRHGGGVPFASQVESEERLSVGPRDFTNEILVRLHQSRRSTGGSGTNRVHKPTVAEKRNGVVLAFRLLALLAASVLALVAVRVWKHNAEQPAVAFNGSQQAGERGDSPPGQSSSHDHAVAAPRPSDLAKITPEAAKSDSASRPRKEPIVLSLDNSAAEASRGSGVAETAMLPAGTSDQNPPASNRTASLQKASLQDFDRQFLTYWKSIGVTPAPAVDETTLANRIADRFGFRPGVGDARGANVVGSGANSVGQVIQELASKELFSTQLQSQLLAERLVKQLAMGLSLSDQRQEQLVASAAKVIQSGGRFDQWISDWVASETIPIESPGSSTAKAATMGEWVAGRVIGADVGCARCHDSPIDSRFNQHDFWAVAALFAPAQTESLFYEMRDGRQRVVSPSAPKRWLGLRQQPGQRDADDALRI